MTYKLLPANTADLLRDAGLNVVEIDGWETRGRPASTGGFNPVGVLCHHTGGASDSREYVEWMTRTGRSDLPAPLCQFALSRAGIVYVCAAGRANHAGTARASGTVAAGDGNAMYLGIEALNTGSEGWTRAQRDAYVTLAAVLSVEITGNSVNTVRAHRETSVTGKWDPGLLDMDAFRADVSAKMNELNGETPTPEENNVRYAKVWLNPEWPSWKCHNKVKQACAAADIVQVTNVGYKLAGKTVDGFRRVGSGYRCAFISKEL